MIKFKLVLSILLFAVLSFPKAEAQSVSFNVTTVTYSGRYAPRHVFAIWITNANGQYVKTINRQSKNYTSTLSNWYGNSGNKTTDGITGASLTTHNAPLNATGGVSRIPFTWNCKDYNGILVSDGTYYINIEFSEESTPKFMRYAFVKGATSQSQTFTNTTTDPGKYFQNATLTFTAPASAIGNTETSEKYEVLFSNPTKQLQIKFDSQYHQDVLMAIYDQDGRLIYKKNKLDDAFSIGLSKLTTGIYFVKLTDQSRISQTYKILNK